MTFSWLLGSAGFVAMEASYLPQIARLHRLKRADEVSVLFPLLNIFGRLLALTHAFLTHQHVFTIGFCVGIVLRSVLLAQVLWFRFARSATRPAFVPSATPVSAS